MSESLPDFENTPRGAAITYQLTSPRTIRAVLALLFSCVAVWQVVMGRPISAELLAIISAIVGYHFRESEDVIVTQATSHAVRRFIDQELPR